MAPMITHLGSIQQGIDKISGGGGEAVRDAIASGAGAEMAGLADAIAAMSVSMATMSARLEKQTGEADRQIEEAVRRFGQASEEMRTAFGDLNRNFGVIADRMREENEQASALARQRMDELLTSLGSTLDDMKAGLAAAATQLGKPRPVPQMTLRGSARRRWRSPSNSWSASTGQALRLLPA
jgi:ABC-type transporter Mla subunit MlaD